MTETNNPFKMIGPWVGIPGGLLVWLYLRCSWFIFTTDFSCSFYQQGLVYNKVGNAIISFFTDGIIYLILGFLLGWGIQTLWRKFT